MWFKKLIKKINIHSRRLLRIRHNLSANMVGIIRLLSPLLFYRPSFYIQHYFDCHRLARENPNKFQRKIHDPIRLLNVFMFWLAIRHTYFAIRYHHIRDQLWDVINSDMLGEVGFDYYANIFMVALIYQSYRYLNMLYLDNPTAQILDRVLIMRENRSFYHPYRYKQYVAVNFMVFIIKIWLYSIYIFKINVDLYLISFSVTAIEFIWNNFNEFFGIGFFGYIRLIQCIINRLILFIGLYVYGHATILMGTICIAYLIVVYIFCWQTGQLLHRGNHHHRNAKSSINLWRTLKRFHMRHTKNLERIITGNIYSRALLIFLLPNIPFNCYLLVFVVCMQTTWIIRYLAGSVIADQIICIFGIHLLFALANRQFQKSSITFIHILAKKHQHLNRHIDLANRLKLVNYGQNFHTKNKYGFTYGKLELISMNECVKYFLLYSQSLMFIYVHVVFRRYH
ncbi:hypothetical protein DERF_012102 [Dermatophagoides farinae]|uniref:Uncharacterized protein n=1 Tax=Dermatophagoides farinae TaxID=6954 RepID=A0A922KWS7_DERFA|nr:hypothetical protein DERF_012102 [Dermatophagoides farinae]